MNTPNFNEIQRAQQIVHRRTGIIIKTHQQENLIKTLSAAQEKFLLTNYTDLLNLLDHCPPDAPEMAFIVNRITIGESYFFRDEEQMDFLRSLWLPNMIASKRQTPNPTLRIWSAGCSSGQEAVTIAILLREAIQDLNQWRIHLLGTDINVESLKQAIAGDYTEWSFRATPKKYRERYFQPVGTEWRIDDSLRTILKFTYLNLIEDAYPTALSQTQAMDLILCRNVFIYFDAETIKKSTQKLVECLNPGGYLVLGATEMIQNQLSGCDAHTHGRYLYFQRQDPLRPAQPTESITQQHHFEPYQLKPTIPINRKGGRKQTQTAAPAPQTPITPHQVEQQIISLMGSESWTKAWIICDQLPPHYPTFPRLLQFKAKILANLGKSEQTITLCNQSIEQESTDKHVYLILGLALLESNDLIGAESAFRKAIFLDRQFLECHFQLGLLLLQTNRAPLGVKSLQNALNLAEKNPPHWIIHNSSNTTFERFAHILRAETTLYTNRLAPK